MPCTRTPFGFVCGPRRPQKRCSYCGKPADRLCDAKLASGPRSGRTCDVPMCDGCTSRPAPDTDYCRDHRAGSNR